MHVNLTSCPSFLLLANERHCKFGYQDRHHHPNRQRGFCMHAPSPSPKPPAQFLHACSCTITQTARAVYACLPSLCHHDDAPNFPGGSALVMDLDHQVEINGPCGSMVLQCHWTSVRRVGALDALFVDIVVVLPSPCTEALSQAYLPHDLASCERRQGGGNCCVDPNALTGRHGESATESSLS